MCGSLACEHLEGEDDDEDDSDDESDLDPEEAPALDGSNDKRKRREAKEASEEEEEEEEEEGDDEVMEVEEWEDEGDDEDSDDEDEMINDTCDIILDDDVRKGEEITRFYGPYPNKVLLSKYGFAVIDNPHDTVTIQLDMVRQVGEKVLKNKEAVEERIQWFLEVEDEFIGADHGDEGEGGCCGGGDHDHNHGHHHGHKHGSSDGEDDHEHADDGSCCGDKDTKKKQKTHSSSDEDEEAEDMDEDEKDEEDEEGEEEDFPRDIMYMMADGTVDDRLFMLLNVLFMEKATFAKVKEDAEAAGEYMNDIFRRRSKEEQGGDEDEEEEEEEEEEPLPPRDKAATKARRAVLEATQALIRVRADAFGVSTKTSAEKDLEALKKVDTYCLRSYFFFDLVLVHGCTDLCAHRYILGETLGPIVLWWSLCSGRKADSPKCADGLPALSVGTLVIYSHHRKSFYTNNRIFPCTEIVFFFVFSRPWLM